MKECMCVFDCAWKLNTATTTKKIHKCNWQRNFAEKYIACMKTSAGTILSVQWNGKEKQMWRKKTKWISFVWLSKAYYVSHSMTAELFRSVSRALISRSCYFCNAQVFMVNKAVAAATTAVVAVVAAASNRSLISANFIEWQMTTTISTVLLLAQEKK